MPAAGKKFPDLVTFAAPIGVRVRLVTILAFALMAAIAFLPDLLAVFGVHRPPSRFVDLIGPAIALPIAGAIWLLAIVRGYELTADELRVVRLGRVNRYPLAGLMSAEENRAALAHAWKTWGNDGLGAVTGRFRSRQLGHFEALLTDPEHAVVLRWPERTLVVSPASESDFVAQVRARAHLRG